MAPVNGKRPSLQSGLDKEVFQIVRKFQDEQPEGSSPLPSVAAVYRYIQASNSTLKRKPKQLLQNSIDRVLAVLMEEEENDSEEVGPMDLDPEDLKIPDRSANFMNKSIIGAWGSSGSATPTATTTATVVTPSLGTETKKRDATRLVNGEPVKKKQRKAEGQIDRSPPTSIRLEDIGGVDNVMKTLEKHLVLPLLMPEEYVRRKFSIPRGILLHGPHGCGKTVLSRAFAAELGVPFVEIQGPSIVSGMSGESEQKVRELFEEARRLAPCLLFIDEIDVIAPKRESSQSQMEKRIVAQLLISMDGLAMDQNDQKPVIVLAATNRPDSVSVF
jgi:ribosome biogenesis ATPase